MFCHITQTWRGTPLTSRFAVVELIASTTTKTGLVVRCELDDRIYPKGIRSATTRWLQCPKGRCSYPSPRAVSRSPTTCPASQGSGNAYAKSLMESVSLYTALPAPDALLEMNAPFYGEVVTLHEPLVRYRMHGSNWSQHNELSPARFLKYLHGQDQKMAYFQDRCRAWGMEFDPEEARRRSVWYLQCQMAAAKLSPPGEAPISPMHVLARAMRAMPTDARSAT
jgi:hypothetical protein